MISIFGVWKSTQVILSKNLIFHIAGLQKIRRNEKRKFLTVKPKMIHFIGYVSLRGQTVHWIGAQLCVCMFLGSRNKSPNMLSFGRNNQMKIENKIITKETSLLRNPLIMHKMHSLIS